jgi:hypothetical protein
MAAEAMAMDDEAKQLLREIRDLQTRQLELLEAAVLPPWLRWRFSLKSLLIVMTLVAVLLGAMVFLRSVRSGPPPPVAVPLPAPLIR